MLARREAQPRPRALPLPARRRAPFCSSSRRCFPGSARRSTARACGCTSRSIEFQPVEIAKLLLVIFFASYFIDKRELLTVPTRRVGNRLFPDLRAFGPIAVAGVMALLIILAEHDIGFSLLLFVVFLSMIWADDGALDLRRHRPRRLRRSATFVASHVLGQVNERITDWLNPWANAAGRPATSRSRASSPSAAAGSSGRGSASASRPAVLPVSSSDFIFAVIGEELGLVGATAVVCRYVLIVGAGTARGAAGALGVRQARRRRTDGDARLPGVPHHGRRTRACCP